MGGDHAAGEGGDVSLVGHVDGITGHAGIGSDDLVQRRLAASGNDHLIAALVKRFGQAPADAGAAASDENGIARGLHDDVLVDGCVNNKYASHSPDGSRRF